MAAKLEVAAKLEGSPNAHREPIQPVVRDDPAACRRAHRQPLCAMSDAENECVARETYAASIDAQYKSKAQQYKRSKDRSRALMSKLGDEEDSLRIAAVAWVHNFTEAQRRATSARGHCEVRALWFSRARSEARALVGETVEGFASTFYRTRLAWALGAGCTLDSVLTHERVATSRYEAYDDDDVGAPDGDDWAAVALPGARGGHK